MGRQSHKYQNHHLLHCHHLHYHLLQHHRHHCLFSHHHHCNFHVINILIFVQPKCFKGSQLQQISGKFSDGLLKSMHCHNDCIYLTFPCIFKSFLKLPAWADTWLHWLHYFCLSRSETPLVTFVQSFPHCVLADVSSKSLPEQKQSDTGHICLASFHCVCRCVLKLLARANTKSHCLHLFDFAPLCVFKCLFKWLAWEDE